MRIDCPHCHSKAPISHSRELMPGVREVTHNCSNPACQSRFITKISYVRDLVPPIPQRAKQLTLDAILLQLPQKERHALAKQLLS